jgi:hypothetical protein
MHEMTIGPLLFSMPLVLLSLLLCLFIKKNWVRLTLIVLIWACLTFTLTIGMGGLRVEIESARANGKSKDYIAGMVYGHAQMRSARIEGLIYALGLFALGFYGFSERYRGKREP